MKKFKKIYIEITNICNLSCSFCPKTKRKQEYMKRAVFERILEQIKGRCKYIYFHVMGEPLLHPEIFLFLDLSEKYGYKVNITTNGTFIDKVADVLITKPSLRQVNFSLHSYEANESVYSMKNYLNKIFAFVDMARRKNILICLRLWNLSDRGTNCENINILRCIKEEFKFDYNIEEKLTPINGIKLAENVFLNQAAKFDWPNLNGAEIDGKGFCYGLRDQVGFLVDGTVIPCCFDGEGIINLGNIKEDSFENIINSKRAKDLFEGFTRRTVNEELCRKCDYRQRFNGHLK
ncbi:MAG: SPASM domain-containing protein [Clostridia bacterium]|nr:SPASM domain-containing protein [Clostridia bacterium]